MCRDDDKPLYRKGKKGMLGVVAYNLVIIVGKKFFPLCQTGLVVLKSQVFTVQMLNLDGDPMQKHGI